jgi:hypothetical protein
MGVATITGRVYGGPAMKSGDRREVVMINRAKIAELERALEEARAQLWKEDGRRYQVIMREMSDAEKERILGSLTDRGERILFGLEAGEEGHTSGKSRPASSGGELECAVCGKSGLTKRGLGLHLSRMHKAEAGEEESVEAEAGASGASLL